ncbi:hypothetical protein [Flavobacterium ginsenosidimutans]|uniref:Tetratricopeptide repeat protein n=1 Tax=Flavobacterium ginsenosidimutans TaxID=687844 RepID=A0ABZ2QBH4_9FLAO|nr:hypothetical protein [Flavobacterium ginsenosidimutans]KAF2332389.1 hypothetical protein DM444_10550 [Flavobacterium ginsenosidimutans]
MKKSRVFFSAFLLIIYLNCFAQKKENTTVSTAKGQTILLTDTQSDENLVIKSYYVEERINKLFGGRIITYEVSKLEMVDTYDLGPNNTRTVIPRYVKRKDKTIAPVESPKAKEEHLLTSLKPVEVAISAPAKETKYTSVDVTGTYAKVLEKGYRTPEMLQKVADRLYFEGNFNTAASYYEQLLNLVKDPDVIYYYRYAQSLKAINQLEKANALMKRFKSKTLVVK